MTPIVLQLDALLPLRDYVSSVYKTLSNQLRMENNFTDDKVIAYTGNLCYYLLNQALENTALLVPVAAELPFELEMVLTNEPEYIQILKNLKTELYAKLHTVKNQMPQVISCKLNIPFLMLMDAPM